MEVELPVGRRAAGLQTVVYTDQSRRPLEPQAEPERIALVRLGAGAGLARQPREGPRVIPEQGHVLARPAGEPARFVARETVTIDAERLLVEAAQARRAAERIALELRQDRLRSEPPRQARLPGETQVRSRRAIPFDAALDGAGSRLLASGAGEMLALERLTGGQANAAAASGVVSGLKATPTERPWLRAAAATSAGSVVTST